MTHYKTYNSKKSINIWDKTYTYDLEHQKQYVLDSRTYKWSLTSGKFQQQ
jgi:hypothetical protein